jgi:hypothetical protein
MWKRLAILGGVALIVAAIAVAAFHQQHNAIGKGYDIDCTQSSVPTDTSASLACKVNPSQEAEQGHSNWQWGYVLKAWPEGITAWLLLLTLGAIAWQAWETRGSAKAARDSIRLQEAALRQWVDVEAVDCQSTEPLLSSTRPKFVVQISFRAVNNTANVFTIRKIETTVSMMPDETEVFLVETNVDLSPRKESESNRYPFYIPVESITKELFTRGTVVTLNGQITFIDCMGDRRQEYFGGLYRCSEGSIEKIEVLGMVPERSVVGPYIPGVPEDEMRRLSRKSERMARREAEEED